MAFPAEKSTRRFPSTFEAMSLVLSYHQCMAALMLTIGPTRNQHGGMKKQRPPGKLTSRRWRRLRDQVVREEPMCRLQLPGCTRLSTTGDHIVPVAHRPDLKFERFNVRGSCSHCNMHRGSRPLESVRRELMRRRQVPSAAALEFFR
jgi:hypothetical protein